MWGWWVSFLYGLYLMRSVFSKVFFFFPVIFQLRGVGMVAMWLSLFSIYFFSFITFSFHGYVESVINFSLLLFLLFHLLGFL